MSALRVRAPLATQLPDATELGAPIARGAAAPEELRLAPIAPTSRVTSVALDAASRPSPIRSSRRWGAGRSGALDARELALLDATATRLGDLDALARGLRPDVAAQLGDRRDAIGSLARELRAVVAEHALLDAARAAIRSA